MYLSEGEEKKKASSDLKLVVLFRGIETGYSFQEEARYRVTIKPSPRLFI